MASCVASKAAGIRAWRKASITRLIDLDAADIQTVHAASLDDILTGAMIAGCRVSAAPGLMELRMNIGVDAGLVGLERCPIDKVGIMFGKEHGPLGHGQMTSSSSKGSLFIDITLMTRLSVGVSASTYQIGEHVMDGSVGRGDPTDLAFHVGWKREGKALGAEPMPDLTDRTQFGEFREDGAKGADNGLVGMKTNFTILFSPNEAHGQAAALFAACGLIADSTIESGAQDVQFRLRHGAFQSQHQAIVKKRRMVETVAISDQSVGHAAQIEQAIPIGIVARQAGDFETEQDSHMAENNFGGHMCEPGTLHNAGTGETKIFVNDDHLFFGQPSSQAFSIKAVMIFPFLVLMGFTKHGSRLRRYTKHWPMRPDLEYCKR